MLRWQIGSWDGGIYTPPIRGIENARLSIGINEQRTATFEVSEEEATNELWTIYPLYNTLRIYDERDDILFNGPIVEANITNGRVSCSAVDVTWYLQLAKTFGFEYQTDVDVSTIMWRLARHGDGLHHSRLVSSWDEDRLQLGTLATVEDRTRRYPNGSDIWGLLQELADGRNSPDFEFEPRDLDGPTMARFNTYYDHFWLDSDYTWGMGADKSEDISLDYGGNAESLAALTLSQRSSVTNRYMVKARVNDVPVVAVAEGQASQFFYGLIQRAIVDTRGNRSKQELRERAERKIARRSYVRNHVEATLAADAAGVHKVTFGPNGDLWLGDVYRLNYRTPRGWSLSFDARIRQADYTVDSNGVSQMKLMGREMLTEETVDTAVYFAGEYDA